MKKEVKASGRADRFTALRAINGSGCGLGWRGGTPAAPHRTVPQDPRDLLHLLPSGTINKPVCTHRKPRPRSDKIPRRQIKWGVQKSEGEKGGFLFLVGAGTKEPADCGGLPS